jgi:hypothetical protein
MFTGILCFLAKVCSVKRGLLNHRDWTAAITLLHLRSYSPLGFFPVREVE